MPPSSVATAAGAADYDDNAKWAVLGCSPLPHATHDRQQRHMNTGNILGDRAVIRTFGAASGSGGCVPATLSHAATLRGSSCYCCSKRRWCCHHLPHEHHDCRPSVQHVA